MEIKEKIELESDDGKDQIDAIIDTGSDISVVDEAILLKIGARFLWKVEMLTAGESAGKKAMYALKFLKIRNCKIPSVTVIGGRKNLLGRDILERGKAKIDEEKGKVEFPEWDGTTIEV